MLTLGGDGTVNEAVNGLLLRRERPGRTRAAPRCPGGNANVFTRALGLPADPVDATGRVIEALRSGPVAASAWAAPPGIDPGAPVRDRYFTFNAGLGLDAEVVRVIEGLRARGRAVTPRLYLRTALRQFYRVTDRRHPALTLERRGHPPVGHLFFGIVSNTVAVDLPGPPAGQSEPGRGFRHRARPLRAPPDAHRGHAERAAPDVRPAAPSHRAAGTCSACTTSPSLSLSAGQAGGAPGGRGVRGRA